MGKTSRVVVLPPFTSIETEKRGNVVTNGTFLAGLLCYGRSIWRNKVSVCSDVWRGVWSESDVWWNKRTPEHGIFMHFVFVFCRLFWCLQGFRWPKKLGTRSRLFCTKRQKMWWVGESWRMNEKKWDIFRFPPHSEGTQTLKRGETNFFLLCRTAEPE